MMTETTAHEEAAPAKKVATKKAPVKKATKKAAKASADGAAKKKAPKAEKTKKEGLRKPQERILKVLAKGQELTRKQIATKAEVDSAACTEYLGSANEQVRLANDQKHFPSLVSLGYVKIVMRPGENGGADVLHYVITATGKKVAAKL